MFSYYSFKILIIILSYSVWIETKRKREQFTRLRSQGIGKHPNYLTNNAHALGRESSTFIL